MAVNADSSQRIRHSVKELGTVTIELIKATGTCQMTPTDSFALRDVSETGRSVGEKVLFFLSYCFCYKVPSINVFIPKGEQFGLIFKE